MYLLDFFGFGVLAHIASFPSPLLLLISALTQQSYPPFSVVLASPSECVTRPTFVHPPQLSRDQKETFTSVCLHCTLQSITKLKYILLMWHRTYIDL